MDFQLDPQKPASTHEPSITSSDTITHPIIASDTPSHTHGLSTTPSDTLPHPWTFKGFNHSLRPSLSMDFQPHLRYPHIPMDLQSHLQIPSPIQSQPSDTLTGFLRTLLRTLLKLTSAITNHNTTTRTKYGGSCQFRPVPNTSPIRQYFCGQ